MTFFKMSIYARSGRLGPLRPEMKDMLRGGRTVKTKLTVCVRAGLDIVLDGTKDDP